MIGLTQRQRELLDYLRSYIAEHGYAPSFDEMGRVLYPLAEHSRAGIHRLLTGLEERGHIRRLVARARAIEIIEHRPVVIRGEAYRFIPKTRAA